MADGMQPYIGEKKQGWKAWKAEKTQRSQQARYHGHKLTLEPLLNIPTMSSVMNRDNAGR